MVRGFTLTELMVVIVIVSILSAIGFSVSKRAISKARTSACLSNLRQMAIIATTEASERGYYPPITSQTKGSGGAVSNNGDHFYSLITHQSCASCPAAKFTGFDPDNGKIITSYGANPSIMPNHVTNDDGTTSNPLVRPAQIKRPSEVILLGDSAQFTSKPRALGFISRWYGKMTGDQKFANRSLTTAEVPAGGFWDEDVPTLPFRHDGKANVVFVDGHAATISQLEDLKQKNLYYNY
ncbi:prepilin-type N-terminal cleavage/methylation domain-containing protein [Haloferula chungangensis]|uniref:Prepilin-type N-terminal cleavage/methylation domain-containing protein n=1 Tax=Haloferula chungangensis TaxID=1048331 RepID=A0ABW2L7Q0_9BACT